MGTNRHPSGPRPNAPVQADTLEQVEPADSADPGEFRSRPFSLTMEELERMPVTMAVEPIAVLAWVRYPAMPVHVQGRALAWTPQAVYVEWEHRGVHRAWVWASAVQRGGLAI